MTKQIRYVQTCTAHWRPIIVNLSSTRCHLLFVRIGSDILSCIEESEGSGNEPAVPVSMGYTPTLLPRPVQVVPLPSQSPPHMRRFEPSSSQFPVNSGTEGRPAHLPAKRRAVVRPSSCHPLGGVVIHALNRIP